MRRPTSTPLCPTDSGSYRHFQDVRARAAPPALLDIQPLLTVGQVFVPCCQAADALNHTSQNLTMVTETWLVPSIPRAQPTHHRHSCHLTALRTTNLGCWRTRGLSVPMTIGDPCSKMVDEHLPITIYHEHYFYIPRHLTTYYPFTFVHICHKTLLVYHLQLFPSFHFRV